MAAWDEVQRRIEAVRTWGRRVGTQVAQLPDTLERLREGAVNFQLVGQRLATTSSSLEELTQLYSRTVGNAVRRTADAAESLQTQLEAAQGASPTPDLLASTMYDLQRTLDSMAALNPFWPPTPERKRKT